MREEPWRRNRRIRNSGRRRGRGNREQQRQRRERQHQPRKRLRREPEREADIEDLFPLVEERSGRSAPGWQDRRHPPGRAALAAPASRQQRKLCFWYRRTTHVGPDGSFVSATAAMRRDITLAPEGLHDSRASGPSGRLGVFRGLYGPLLSDGFRRIG